MVTLNEFVTNEYVLLFAIALPIVGFGYQLYDRSNQNERVSVVFDTLCERVFRADDFSYIAKLGLIINGDKNHELSNLTRTFMLIWNNGNRELNDTNFASFPLVIQSSSDSGQFVSAQIFRCDVPESGPSVVCVDKTCTFGFEFFRRRTAYRIDLLHTFPMNTIFLHGHLKNTGKLKRVDAYNSARSWRFTIISFLVILLLLFSSFVAIGLQLKLWWIPVFLYFIYFMSFVEINDYFVRRSRGKTVTNFESLRELPHPGVST